MTMASRVFSRLLTTLVATLAATLVPALVVIGSGGGAATAEAGTFQISPTRVDLEARGSSSILTLSNTGVEAVRLQVRVYAWTQSPSGEQVLTEARDLVVFPTLFSLAPKESRKVKVGITIPQDARQRTYRLIVEELPPTAAGMQSGLRVLTRMSVPIFQAPLREVRSGVVAEVKLRSGVLAINVENRGTVSVMLRAAKALGRDAAGREVWSGEAAGWYLLAGGRRAFELQVPSEEAARISSVEVEALTEKETWTRRVKVSED